MGEQDITTTVSFRLRVDQKVKLEELRSIEGARSISDLYRQAVDKLICELTMAAASEGSIGPRVTRLEKKVASLALDMEAVKALRPVVPSENDY
jgi:hypothetical protein